MKSLCSECFKALGVESRAKIYEFINQNSTKNVKQITEFLGLRQPTISYHLKEMVSAGLLSREANGKEVYYTVNTICPHDGEKCIIQDK